MTLGGAINFAARKIRGALAASNRNTRPGEQSMATVAKLPVKGQLESANISWLSECIKRGKREVFSETVMMNPGVAAELLRRNPDNRVPKSVKSAHFAADMAAGRWAFNGESIIVSQDGLLNDGQHRMQAMVDANLALPMIVVFGVERSTRTTLDQGSARTAGDYLHMDGATYGNQCASIARVILAFEASDGRHIRDAGRFTNAQILARIAADDGILKAAEYAARVGKHTSKFAAPAVVGAAFYLLADINVMEARDYMDRVCVGEGLRIHQPPFTVRETLLKMGKGARQSKLEVIFHGWNKFRAGGTLRLIRVNGNFPALV
jgi:hypothetical protein